MKTTQSTPALLTGLLLFIASAIDAAAATLVVTNADDSGPGSLRDAIVQANSNGEADTIQFALPFFGTSRTIVLASEIQITADGTNPGQAVTIDGPGETLLTISGGNAVRPFFTDTYSVVSIKRMTIRDGNGVGTVLGQEGNSGGAILVTSSALTLTNVTVRNNTVPDFGGGIYLNATKGFSATDCLITENSAGRRGGGIYDTQGIVKTLVNTTISNNSAADDVGGALFSTRDTTITNCRITGNRGGNSIGGLQLFSTEATVTDTTISGNVAGVGPSGGNPGSHGYIGGVHVDTASPVVFRRVTVSGNSDYSGSTSGGAGMDLRGSVTVIDSLVSNNRHYSIQVVGPFPITKGAGIVTSTGAGTIDIINTTIVGNVAENGVGGGIYNNADGLRVINSTIVNNVSEKDNPGTTADGGGGIYSDPDRSITVENSIIANNTGPTGPDVTNAFTSNGYNIIGNTANSTGFGAMGDQLNVNPLLDPAGLQNNGGATLTIALLPNSPAIDQGKSAVVTTDQRGFPRPLDYSEIANAAGGDGSDIGALESGAASRALNISTRTRVLNGNNVLIGGFIITGTEPKQVLIRAMGPSLAGLDAIADPTLELFGGNGVSIVFNDNWRDTQEAEIQGTTIPPGNDLEAAILRTLNPGNYTAIMRGSNDTTGIGVVEVYDLDHGTQSKLANISSRAYIDTGDNALIGGFIIGGNNTRVLLRAMGPSLGFAGALQDPTLQLIDANGGLVRENDNWKSDQQAEIEATGIPPGNDAEAAIIATLPLGTFTAVVRGSGGSVGVGLVELYNIQ